MALEEARQRSEREKFLGLILGSSNLVSVNLSAAEMAWLKNDGSLEGRIISSEGWMKARLRLTSPDGAVISFERDARTYGISREDYEAFVRSEEYAGGVKGLQVTYPDGNRLSLSHIK